MKDQGRQCRENFQIHDSRWPDCWFCSSPYTSGKFQVTNRILMFSLWFQILDEVQRILTCVTTAPEIGKAYKVTEELYDLSAMAMEYFKDKLEPTLPEISYLSSDFGFWDPLPSGSSKFFLNLLFFSTSIWIFHTEICLCWIFGNTNGIAIPIHDAGCCIQNFLADVCLHVDVVFHLSNLWFF